MKLRSSFSHIPASLAAGIIISGAYASAASIGVNFVGGDGPGNTTTKVLASTDLAGVDASTNWNNATGNSLTTISNLNSDAGATTASVTYAANGIYTARATPAMATPNQILMIGYVDDLTNAGDTTISFANLPFVGNYEVYVYYGSDNNNRTGTITLGSTVYNIRTNTSAFTTFTPGTLAADDPDPGNYVLFSGVNGAAFTVSAARGSNNIGVHGIQVVGTIPEPTGISLLGLGTLAMLARRRRN